MTGPGRRTPDREHPELDNPPADPLALWREWVTDATERGVADPMAASLATVDEDGAPVARFVALKDLTASGAVFATSALSPKGRQMRADPRVALTQFWVETMEQVRVHGQASMLDDAASDRLFAERPREAQAAVIIARQSEQLESEEDLERRVHELARRGGELARPAQWRDWLVVPHAVEFWVGGRERLHRRLAYTRTGAVWTARRLQP